MEFRAKVRTCLWFDGNGHEAAAFYVSLLPDSYIENTVHPKPDEPPLVVEFTLAGAPMMVLNGGPQFPHSEAASISVLTKDQEETDRLWSALTAHGGTESMCAWLKDKYGVSWQIVPEALPRLLASDDRAAAGRAMAAMMQMQKIDIAALQAAFDGA
jgi:predicted 3-demethylubiquinone-9 3-methyltransferase (glyoxalase superfamily)